MLIKNFNIIYELSEWITSAVKERTPKTDVEVEKGRAVVAKVFSSQKDKHVFGGRIKNGTIELNSQIKIMRNDAEICRGKITNLQKLKEKVAEVNDGEFGSEVTSKIPPASGDTIISFSVETK